MNKTYFVGTNSTPGHLPLWYYDPGSVSALFPRAVCQIDGAAVRLLDFRAIDLGIEDKTQSTNQPFAEPTIYIHSSSFINAYFEVTGQKYNK